MRNTSNNYGLALKFSIKNEPHHRGTHNHFIISLSIYYGAV